jgi:hypothetical protein
LKGCFLHYFLGEIGGTGIIAFWVLIKMVRETMLTTVYFVERFLRTDSISSIAM